MTKKMRKIKTKKKVAKKKDIFAGTRIMEEFGKRLRSRTQRGVLPRANPNNPEFQSKSVDPMKVAQKTCMTRPVSMVTIENRLMEACKHTGHEGVVATLAMFVDDPRYKRIVDLSTIVLGRYGLLSD